MQLQVAVKPVLGDTQIWFYGQKARSQQGIEPAIPLTCCLLPGQLWLRVKPTSQAYKWAGKAHPSSQADYFESNSVVASHLLHYSRHSHDVTKLILVILLIWANPFKSPAFTTMTQHPPPACHQFWFIVVSTLPGDYF